jgi:hypothetical protein
MPALGLAGWWDEPHYRHCYTANLRGEFILAKLLQRDPPKLRALMASLYADGEPLPENLSAAEWATILTAMGASPDEIAEVQARMGRADI